MRLTKSGFAPQSCSLLRRRSRPPPPRVNIPSSPRLVSGTGSSHFTTTVNSQPPCTKEYANVAMDVKTDDVVQRGVVGTHNVRMAVRIMGGDGCAPKTGWVEGPAAMGPLV